MGVSTLLRLSRIVRMGAVFAAALLQHILQDDRRSLRVYPLADALLAHARLAQPLFRTHTGERLIGVDERLADTAAQLLGEFLDGPRLRMELSVEADGQPHDNELRLCASDFLDDGIERARSRLAVNQGAWGGDQLKLIAHRDANTRLANIQRDNHHARNPPRQAHDLERKPLRIERAQALSRRHTPQHTMMCWRPDMWSGCASPARPVTQSVAPRRARMTCDAIWIGATLALAVTVCARNRASVLVATRKSYSQGGAGASLRRYGRLVEQA